VSATGKIKRVRRTWAWAGCAAALVAVLALVRPWVVVPLHGQGTGTVQADVVDAAWQRLLAGIDTAHPIASLKTAQGTPVLVHARGVLVAVDTASMSGWARVALASTDAPAQALLQLGPVVRGTALRDVAGLSYDDFDTQVTYARAANTLNERAVQALNLDELTAWIGQVIVVTGVATASPTDEIPIDVVPLRIALEAPP